MWLPPLLDDDDPEQFPDISCALVEPNGLLAVGGDLKAERLLAAYRRGIFPWYSAGQPILWWSPDPRMVLFPDKLKVARSLRKTIRSDIYGVTLDRAFVDVVNACAENRPEQQGTWITAEMVDAYTRLYRLGHAHSVESWFEGELVGGLYGVAIGRVFFGESMFYRRRDASKVAFVSLVENLHRWGYQVVDCQIASEHLQSFGAIEIERDQFAALLARCCDLDPNADAWTAVAPLATRG